MKLKNILITGSSSGIGFYIAQSLSNLVDYKVFLNGKNIDKLKKAKKKIVNSSYIRGDVTKEKNRRFTCFNMQCW